MSDAVPDVLLIRSTPKCPRRVDRRNAPQCNAVESLTGNTKRVIAEVI